MAKANKKNKFEIARLFGNFALKLLNSSIKEKILAINQDSHDISLLEKLNPLLILVVSCLESTNNSMISHSMKFLYLTIKWPLITIKKNYKKITNSLLKILQNLNANEIEMVQETFRLLTEILASEDARPFFTEKQIKCIIEFIEVYAFLSEKATESLECLRVFILIL